MKTWLLPPGAPSPPPRAAGAGPAGLEFPKVDPALINDTVRRLLKARPALAKLRTETILRAIEESVAQWLIPGNESRRRAEDGFRAGTGMSTATAPFSPVLEACEGPRFRDWARGEVDPFAALERFTPGPNGVPLRALGPALVIHVLPGNVPMIWLPSFLACVIMRSPNLIKPSFADPLSPSLFCATLLERLPALAPALAVLPWEGGDKAVEEAAIPKAAALVAYGQDPTIRSLVRCLPAEAKLAAHGPRFAAGVIARESAAPGRFEPIAAAAARDALLYDGGGCLSLTTLVIEEGGIYSVAEAVQVLARALAETSTAFPPGPRDRESAALLQSWRARIRARALAGKSSALFGAPGDLDWTLLFDANMAPPPPLARCIWVTSAKDIKESPQRLASFSGRLHALAFSGPADRRNSLAEQLMPLGLTRVCEFGSLQTPPLIWPHDGTSPFRRFLNWAALER